MSVFVVGLLHTSIVCRVLGIFLKVVHRRIGDDAGNRNRVSHVLGQRSGVAFHIPAAAVIRFEQKLIVMRGLLQASGNRTGVTLAFVIVIGHRPNRHKTGKQQTKSQLLHKLFPPGSAFREFDDTLGGPGCAQGTPQIGRKFSSNPGQGSSGTHKSRADRRGFEPRDSADVSPDTKKIDGGKAWAPLPLFF